MTIINVVDPDKLICEAAIDIEKELLALVAAFTQERAELMDRLRKLRGACPHNHLRVIFNCEDSYQKCEACGKEW